MNRACLFCFFNKERSAMHLFSPPKNMNYFYNKAAENRVGMRKQTVGRFFFETFSDGCFLPFQ